MYCSRCGVKNEDEASFCKNCGNAIGLQQDVNNSQLVLPASLAQRFVHNIVDSIAMYVFGAIIAVIAIAFFGKTFGMIIGLISIFAYHFIFEALFQKTLGKLLTGSKVVSITGEKPSLLALFGRTLARYIPFEPWSFLFYGSYPTLGWHDRLSETLVVPKELTKEQIKTIDQKEIKRQKQDSAASVILIVLAGGLFFVFVIGVLTVVVLASLNDARKTADDAFVKDTLTKLQTQADIYYVNNDHSYEDYCVSVKPLLVNQEYTCIDNVDTYIVTSELKENYFCVDSSGFTKEIDGEVSGNQTSCTGVSYGFNNDLVTKITYQELKQVEEYLNSQFEFPTMIDNETRLEKIYASVNNKINYNYTLINFYSNEIEWSVFEENMFIAIKDAFCSDTSFGYNKVNSIPMVSNYYSRDKLHIGSIEVSGNDCK